MINHSCQNSKQKKHSPHLHRKKIGSESLLKTKLVSKCLQLKVYFDISYYTGKRGVEGLRKLKKDSSEIKLTNGVRNTWSLNTTKLSKSPTEMTTMKLNGCKRNTTAACDNVATGLLLRLHCLVHFF